MSKTLMLLKKNIEAQKEAQNKISDALKKAGY